MSVGARAPCMASIERRAAPRDRRLRCVNFGVGTRGPSLAARTRAAGPDREPSGAFQRASTSFRKPDTAWRAAGRLISVCGASGSSTMLTRLLPFSAVPQ